VPWLQPAGPLRGGRGDPRRPGASMDRRRPPSPRT
jgi:hypothetical protein